MTLEEQIASLLEEAAPLRLLNDDDPEKDRLGGIVDRINALRAEQSKVVASFGGVEEVIAHLKTPIEGQDAPEAPHVAPPPVKRGPGRPRKAE